MRTLKECKNCSRLDRYMKYCSACLTDTYCNSSCQKMNWKIHRKTCNKNNAAVEHSDELSVYPSPGTDLAMRNEMKDIFAGHLMERFNLSRNKIPAFCFFCGDIEEECKLFRGAGVIICKGCKDIQFNMCENW